MFLGNEDALHRTGESALSTYERLLTESEELEADVTIILEPLTNLLLKYRGEDKAKDVLKNLTVRYFGNEFVENAYYRFLKLHYPFETEELEYCEKVRYFS